MKTVYVLDGSDLVFLSWEDCMKFIKKCNAEADYAAISRIDFIKYHIWEEEE